jgi:hypothetical protein
MSKVSKMNVAAANPANKSTNKNAAAAIPANNNKDAAAAAANPANKSIIDKDAAAANPAGTMAVEVKTEVKLEADHTADEDFADDFLIVNLLNRGKNNKVDNNNKGKAATPTTVAQKKVPKEKRTVNKKLLSSEVAHSYERADIMRCGDSELEKKGKFKDGKLAAFIERHVGAGYKRLPRGAIADKAKTARLYALTFAWSNGERVFMQLSRIRLVRQFNEHPKKAPKGEPKAVTRDIDTEDKNNGLVLVKHADENGIQTAERFPGLTKATALVSLDLLFYIEN